MTDVALSVAYRYPVELVWRSITDPVVRGQWFPSSDVTALPGAYRIAESAEFGAEIAVTVTNVAPHRQLAMTWIAPRTACVVLWTLASTPGGCRLTVTQAGELGGPPSIRRRHLEEVWWRMLHQQLPTVLYEMAQTSSGRHRRHRGWGGIVAAVLHRPPSPVLTRLSGWLVAVLTATAVGAGGVCLVDPSIISGWRSPGNDGTDLTLATSPAPARLVGGVPGGGGGAGVAGETAPAVSVSRPVSPSPASPSASASPTATVGGSLQAAYTSLSTAGAQLRAAVTVSYHGSGSAPVWAVTVRLPAGVVVDSATGVSISQVGSVVVFRPTLPRPLTAGQRYWFSFTAASPSTAGSGAVGARTAGGGVSLRPLSCSINGVACSGLG